MFDPQYHLDAAGQPHLKGHCDGESRWLRHPTSRYVEYGFSVCSGCEELIPDDDSNPHEWCIGEEQ